MKTDLLLKYSVVLAFLVWGACVVMDVGSQRKLFYDEGLDLLSDYWMPRTVLVEGYAEVGNEFPTFLGRKRSGWVNGTMRVVSFDRCYPAFALMSFAVFPATWGGAYAWSILTTFAFIGVLCVLSRSAWPFVLLCSMPVLYNLERGNPIILTAALIAVFLSWYRSESQWKRIVAVVAISAATCLKITPVTLGAFYLREKDWKSIGLCIVCTCVFFFVPWFLIPGGISNLPLMVANASEHSSYFARAADFGLVGIWRIMRIVFHQDCTCAWPGCMAVAYLSQILGLMAIAWGAWRRNILWAVVGMLWAAGNMHYYGALYLLPVLVLEPPKDWRTAVLWFVILCPLQFIVMGHSANQSLCNLGALALCVMSVTFKNQNA